jgi:hypothetical protein
MTKDNVNVHITSVIYYHIINPYKSTFGIGNVRTALMERTQTTLRHVLGARVLQDVIERREEIAQSIEEIIADVAMTWGVKVESILIKDINFSRELQDSLSMAAQSKRIGESKVILSLIFADNRLLLPELKLSPLNSCVKQQISLRPRPPCKSVTSRQCNPWPNPQIVKSSLCPPHRVSISSRINLINLKPEMSWTRGQMLDPLANPIVCSTPPIRLFNKRLTPVSSRTSNMFFHLENT